MKIVGGAFVFFVAMTIGPFTNPTSNAYAQPAPPDFPMTCNPPQPCGSEGDRRDDLNRQWNLICGEIPPGNGNCSRSQPIRVRITAPSGDWEEYTFTPCPSGCMVPPSSPATPGNRSGSGAGGGTGGGMFDEIGN